MASKPLTFAELISAGYLEIGDGYRAKNEELGGEGLIFLRAGHVKDTHVDFDGADRFHTYLESRVLSKAAEPGDSIITTKGNSTGRTGFVAPGMPPFVYSPHLSYWRTRAPERISAEFLRYWCKSSECAEQLAGMKASTDMAPYLSLADQKRLRISLPPIHEQRTLSRILGSLDDKIELNRRMNRTLEDIAQTLFRAWFVDFEGETDLADSELGPIPQGWKIESIETLANLSTTSVRPASEPQALWEHFSIPAFDAGQLPARELGKSIKSSKYRVPPSAILVSKLNPRFPRVWRPSVTDADRAICSTELMSFVPREEWSRPFLYELLRSHSVQARIRGMVTGSTGSRQRVRPQEVAKLRFAVSGDVRLVREFCSRVGPLHERVQLALDESRTLAELRDTLLPKLISGEIRVPEAEKVVEEVV